MWSLDVEEDPDDTVESDDTKGEHVACCQALQCLDTWHILIQRELHKTVISLCTCCRKWELEWTCLGWAVNHKMQSFYWSFNNAGDTPNIYIRETFITWNVRRLFCSPWFVCQVSNIFLDMFHHLSKNCCRVSEAKTPRERMISATHYYLSTFHTARKVTTPSRSCDHCDAHVILYTPREL